MIRLLLPVTGFITFLALSWTTVRVLRPSEPRRYFLGYAALLALASALVYVTAWPLVELEDALGLVCCLLLQVLACLTFWNSFYSLLWGFSGGLMHDLYNKPALRSTAQLVTSYSGEGGVDRIMARRLPNLQRGGWIVLRDDTLVLTGKGRVMAVGTLAAFKLFSLGMGGGVK